MHPFPDAAELQFLMGKELGQIALDPWSLQFRFSDGGQISVEGCIDHIDETGTVHSHDCQQRTGDALYLHQLLQHPITAIGVEPLCLSLKFEGGALLKIYTDLGQYECGQIYPSKDKGIIIVF
jgi:hypothetical protein